MPVPVVPVVPVTPVPVAGPVVVVVVDVPVEPVVPVVPVAPGAVAGALGVLGATVAPLVAGFVVVSLVAVVVEVDLLLSPHALKPRAIRSAASSNEYFISIPL